MMKNVEIPKWLERLPLAPEFRPTDTEFADPIAYISKIEKEASAFGICKVIPPLAKPSRKYVLHNLNMSLSKCPELGSDVNLVTSSKTDSDGRESSDKTVNSGDTRAVFTTRHQELGCEKGRKVKGAVGDVVFGAQKQVWQSGEVYTLEQFEAKSKNFAKSQLGMMKEVYPLVIEAMFWKAASEKPIYVEYANDVPGSGFGEPERLLRYCDRHRRRRRRKRNSFDRNNLGNADGKSDQVHKLNSIRDDKDSGVQNNLNFCTETTTNYLPSGQLHHHCSSFSGQKDFQGSCDMEGTAGWKLSNSPWNLQVIARSPGSLTRFMPDDIPGVTSPMVYVGMLFSWFAWHVEDHELHSLNFLHMGAPKTWYAVPGDYAFNFEEAIRLHAYGGNADRLVTLSLLGEKTTVLSPEVIVASGIPCCRLVQNPGEFVVTFPRAYHVGFSHGFNCGEAANFGTPKWLTIAKEAAVRRAAMNYLPMLSHQQLLYLLTMSFISRIPRSLLPGVRSSRLRDRQKEERELLVKRAFLEDIMHENRLLTVLLGRNSSYHAVLWDAESLPSSNKESETCKDDASTFISTEKASPENEDYIHDVNELGKYISSLDFDLNDDDLAYDFQVESGTLPCVACGILGFPFMAVVQPSEGASFEFLLMDPYSVTVESGLLSEGNHVPEGSTKDAYEAKLNKALHDANEIPSVVGTSQSTDLPIKQSPVPGHSSLLMHDISSKIEISEGWNISNVSLKPRIFCLEHAIEIEKLLSSKGGANVLVICHSDFQKIKTHAAVIAEEISIPFCYNEMSLGDASQEELNVIDVAIDREDMVDLAEDWTSQLSINLQHCVKVKKSSPSKNVQHLLSLGASLCDKTPISNASDMKWLSRKSRSKRHLKHSKGKSSECNLIVTEGVETNKEHQMAKNDVKIIQYSRKKFKARASAELLAPMDTTSNPVVQDILDTYPEATDNEDKSRTRAIPIRVENENNFSGPSAFASDGKSELLCQHVLLSGRGHFENSFPSRHEISVIASITMTDNVETETSICVANEVTLNDKAGGSCHDSQALEFTAADGSTQSNEWICSEIVVSTSDKNSIDFAAEGESLREEDKINEFSVTTNTCNRLSENDCDLSLRSDGDDLIKKTSRHGGASNCSDEESPLRCDVQTEIISGQLVMDGEVSQSPRTEQRQHLPTDGNDQEKSVSGYIALINESNSASIEENLVSDAPVLMGSLDASGKSVFLPDQKVLDDSNSTMEQSKSMAKAGGKRRREVDLQPEGHFLVSGFIRSPCEGLRSRARKDASSSVTDNRRPMDEALTMKKLRKSTDHSVPCKGKREHQRGCYKCELDGCTMSFQTKAELLLHKSNRCPVDGCRKKFNSHKYAIQHQRVHDDHRPLKCPWNGCAMSFKWAWARTEHLRVHTGERPYVCKVEGCGLTFRFVSDFSRHRRKTGHYVSPSA